MEIDKDCKITKEEIEDAKAIFDPDLIKRVVDHIEAIINGDIKPGDYIKSVKDRVHEDMILVYELRLRSRFNESVSTVALSDDVNKIVDFYTSQLLDKMIFCDDGPSTYFKEGPLEDYEDLGRLENSRIKSDTDDLIEANHYLQFDTGLHLKIMKKEEYEKSKLKLED